MATCPSRPMPIARANSKTCVKTSLIPAHADAGKHSASSCPGWLRPPNSETPSLPASAAPSVAPTSSPGRKRTAITSTATLGHTASHLHRCRPPQTPADPAAPPHGEQRTPSDSPPTRPLRLAAASRLDQDCTAEIVTCFFFAHLPPKNKCVLTHTRKGRPCIEPGADCGVPDTRRAHFAAAASRLGVDFPLRRGLTP